MAESDGFCCDMKAMTPEQRGRYEILRRKLEAAVASVYELPDGYRMQFIDGAISLQDLVVWTVFERKCCPFLTLTLDGKPESLAVRITGCEGVKDFIRAEFSAIRFE